MLPRFHPFASTTTKLAFAFSGLLAIACLLLSAELYAQTHHSAVPPLYSIVILGLLLSICAGLFGMGFYVTRRINAIASTADRIITTRDLSQRIPIDSRWDDLGQLAAVLNHMLEEIDRHVASIRQVSDNIAHDLRTPLTRLRNHIEQVRPGQQDSAEFALLINECDALLATFNALLRITNLESGRRAAVFQPVNLAGLLEDVVELYEPVASEKQVSLSFAFEPATVSGDKDLLFQALANLLDNAIKYTPGGGVVVARVAPRGSGATVTIRDSGPGITDAHKTLVFQRFYRVESSRSEGGAGLGLSLVAAIVRLHQGRIELEDREPSGLGVTVTL